MRRIAMLVVLVCGLPIAAGGQILSPVGGVFQVNTYTSGYQHESAVCNAADGGFVVVWASYYRDGDGSGVFGQRYGSAGNRVGTEFQVNTYTFGFQSAPAVCCAPGGDFVVIWEDGDGEDGGGDGIFGQRFASNGAFRGTEFQVNTYTSDDQRDPRVCCAADGAFVVTWEDADGQDFSDDGIFAQRFASNGAFRGTEFQVNTYTTSDQSDPAICCTSGGDFAITWESQKQDGGENGDGIFAQRFASAGQPLGTEFQVNTYTSAGQFDPEICCDGEGNFNIVWWGYAGQDGQYGGIFGQRFTSDGAARGTEFQVNQYTPGHQNESEICCTEEGGFVVVWSSYATLGFESPSVRGRRFASNGAPMGPDFQIQAFATEADPAVACTGVDGGFVVIWDSPEDGARAGVFGQRFAIVGVVPTPTLSFGALAVAALALLGAGAAALRRRRR